MTMPILGGDGWVGDSLKNGREALKNTYISNHYSGDNPDPVVQNFVKAYPRSSASEPDSIAALGLRLGQGARRRHHPRRVDRGRARARHARGGRRAGRDRPAEDERAA